MQRSSLAIVVGAMLVTTAAAAQERFDQNDGRVGIVDRSTVAGFQPRVWSNTLGGRLCTRDLERQVGGWITTSITGVSTGVDAISITSGASVVERVFYTRAGSLRMLNADGDVIGAESVLPSVGDLDLNGVADTVRGVDVAAVTYVSAGGVQRMAVAAATNTNFICIWDTPVTVAFPTPQCSASTVGALTDISGAVVGSTPGFFYRRDDQNLGMARGSSAGVYSYFDLGRPPSGAGLQHSLAATASSIDTSKYEVAVSSSTAVFAARVSTSGAITWTSLPSLGVPTPKGDDASIGITRFTTSSGSRMAIFVETSTSTLAQIRTGASLWNASWEPGFAAPAPDQAVSVAAAAALPQAGFERPVALFQSGIFALFWAEYTLGEFSTEGGFRDFIRANHNFVQDPDSGSVTAGDIVGEGRDDPGSATIALFDATESSVSSGGVFGAATALRRNPMVPWEVVLSSSDNNGAWFDVDFVVDPLAPTSSVPRNSISDPSVAIFPGRATMHHVVLEVGMAADSATICHDADNGNHRVVYRRGSTASAVAALNEVTDPGLFLVQQGALDHPGIAVTDAGSGNDTVHIAYWNLSSGVFYWRRDGAGVITHVLEPNLPSNPAGVFNGDGSRVFGYSFNGGGRPTVCQLFPTPTTNCGVLGSGATFSPFPDVPSILFGTSAATADFGTGRTCSDGAGNFRQCFGTDQPVSFAGSPTTNRVYAVWQADDPTDPGNEVSVYFARTEGGNNADWTEAVRVHTRTDGSLYFIDPEITVDENGFLIVTFSTVQSGLSNPAASQEIWVSTDDGATFTQVTGISLPTWAPANLPLHCSRHTFFLGEYRSNAHYIRRAQHLLHFDTSGVHRQTGFWANRWTLF